MKKEKISNVQLTSPLNGKCIALNEVPDPVFSQKMMGEGCAIIPTDGNIYSPIKGTVTMIAATKHAYGIQGDDGLEVLVHFGLETVEGETPAAFAISLIVTLMLSPLISF